MLIPFVGYRNYNGTPDAGTYGGYWSSSPDGSAGYARNFSFGAGYLYADSSGHRGDGYAVRCFKNSYIELPKALTFFTVTVDVSPAV